MKTKLYFVRHAHSVYTTDERNRPLSADGKVGAEKVAEVLMREGIERVLSSPYKRSIETVEKLADAIGEQIELIEDFRERQLSEGPVEDFTEAITKVWKDENYAFDGGESNQEAKERGVAATRKILKRYPGERIAIGTHGNLMVLVMNYFDKRFGMEFWRELAMPDVYCLSFNELELTEVRRINMEEAGT